MTIFRRGKKHSEGGGVPDAMKKRLSEAESGDPRAQYEIGLMYQEGDKVPKDNEEAAKWFRRSAEQDDFAEFCVGVLYNMGPERTQDHEEMAKQLRRLAEIGLGDVRMGPEDAYRESEKWLKLSAEQGSVFAQMQLGFMYQEGTDGIPPNYEESAKWIRLAAEKGDTTAQCNLGYLYESGLGVPKDREEAVKWYISAAEQGHNAAEEALHRLFDERR